MARSGRWTHAVCRTLSQMSQRHTVVYLAGRPDRMDTDLREPQAFEKLEIQLSSQATSTTLES